jgi:hypothetical protein
MNTQGRQRSRIYASLLLSPLCVGNQCREASDSVGVDAFLFNDMLHSYTESGIRKLNKTQWSISDSLQQLKGNT